MTGISGLALGIRLSGESVNDATLAQMYGDQSLSGEVLASSDLPHGFRAQVLVGYRRMGGNLIDSEGDVSASPTWIRYLPIAGTIGLHKDFGRVDLGAGVGPATVAFAEQVGEGEAVTSRGWKWGALVEGGVRIHLGELQATDSAFHFDASAGYRAMLRRHGPVCGEEPVCGLDLSAVRVGVGVVVVL